MSQYDHGTISPSISGTVLADILSQSNAAKLSGHSGASRPTYATKGLVWVKTVSSTVEETYYFDGTRDVLLWTINPTTHQIATDYVPKTREIIASSGVTINGGASATLGGTVTVGLDLSAKALAQNVWTAGVSTTPAPIDPATLKAVVSTAIAAPPITKVYESAQQAVVSGGSVTLAHGMGAAPKLVQIEAICVTAESGFVVGQVVVLTGNSMSGTSVNRNLYIRSVDATSIVLQYGDHGTPLAVFKADGSFVPLTNANWRTRVRAFA